MEDRSYPAVVNPGVYPPAEDTFILLDSIDVAPNDIMLDMGCGSGYISLNFANRVKELVAVDVQYNAVRNTQENLLRYQMMKNCQVVQSDLLTAISPSRRFSVIAFNPPYLPQDEDSPSHDPALIGGEKGVEVSERFLVDCVTHLKEFGRVYLVASNLSNIGYLIDVMESIGLQSSIVSEESLFFEKLVVLRGVMEK